MPLRALRPHSTLTPPSLRATPFLLLRPPHHRSFISSPFSSASDPPTSLSASRTLLYPTQPIFDIIADIPAYPKFLPFCTSATVLASSPRPDAHTGRSWPASASLGIGFANNIQESFVSAVFCVPPTPHTGRAGVGFVEALSGSDAPPPTFTEDEDVSHYDVDALPPDARAQDSPLAFLRTRWTVRSFPHKPSSAGRETHSVSLEPTPPGQERTDVSLVVEYRFRNPIYEVMSKAAAPKVADMMVEAFEKRVKEVLGEAR